MLERCLNRAGCPADTAPGQKIIARVEVAAPICIERFDEHPQLGRFTLRDEGKTIAIGKVTKRAFDALSISLISQS